MAIDRLWLGGVLGPSRYPATERTAIERARDWLKATALLDRAYDPAGSRPQGVLLDRPEIRWTCLGSGA